MAKNYFSHKLMLAVLVLALFIPAGIFSETKPDLRGFDLNVFDYHFEKADRELSPELWMNEARRGISLARSAWERIAVDIYTDPVLREEVKKEIVEWSETELEERFSQWLVKRFFGNGVEQFTGNISSEIKKANLLYTYHLDEDGNIIYNDESGDPELIRPGETDSDFSADREAWQRQISLSAHREAEAYQSKLSSLFPELLRFIPEENRGQFEKSLEANSVSAAARLRREFEEMIRREERLFTSRRMGDVFSLRKKSENESAEVISARIIQEAEMICDEGIASLTTRIESAETGEGDLVLAGAAWLEAYRDQFERGLKAWEAAEERFFTRRLEWEQEAGRNFFQGEEAWIDAFNKFGEERQKWELKAKELFDSGEQMFRNASETLERTIAEARQELARDAQLRISAGTDRAKAWVDMYITCGNVVSSARENIEIWLGLYNAGAVPSFGTVEFSRWLGEEIADYWKKAKEQYEKKYFFWSLFPAYQKIEEAIKGELEDYQKAELVLSLKAEGITFSDRFDMIQEIKKWSDLYHVYLEKAIEARDALVNDFTVAMGGGGLTDILAEGVSSEDFTLDEYQIELIRAKAVAGYWEKRMFIAEAVSHYAKEISAGRMTDGEGIKAWEDARQFYDNALSDYEAAGLRLGEAGTELGSAQNVLNEAAGKLAEANRNLEDLNRGYAALMTALLSGNHELILDNISSRYTDLIQEHDLLSGAAGEPVYGRYLERLAELAFAQDKEQSGSLLMQLIMGDNDTQKSLAELFAAASAIMNVDEADEISDYQARADKEKAERDLAVRKAALKLLSENSSSAWYLSLHEEDEEIKESLEQKGIEEQLRYDADSSNFLLFRDKLNLELEALRYCINGNPAGENAKALSAFFVPDPEITQETLVMLEYLLGFCAVIDPEDPAEYIKKLEDMAGGNKIMLAFIHGKSYFIDSSGSSAGEYFLGPRLAAKEWSEALLDIYRSVFPRTAAGKKELGEKALADMRNLFTDYGITFDNTDEYLPGMRIVGDALFAGEDNPGKSTISFLVKIDDLFERLPRWLIADFDSWKESLLVYMAARIVYTGEPYNQTFWEEGELEYGNYFNAIYTVLKADSEKAMQEGKTHWRQFISEEYLGTYKDKLSPGISGDPEGDYRILKAADEWNEGVLAGFFDRAEAETAKLNAVLALFTEIDAAAVTGAIGENIQFYLDDPAALWDEEFENLTPYLVYDNCNYELGEIQKHKTLEEYLQKEIEQLGRSYEFATKGKDAIKNEMDLQLERIRQEEHSYAEAEEAYSRSLLIFQEAGSVYNKVYGEMKNLYSLLEDARFGYEKEDAIRRWAGTAYLEAGNNPLNSEIPWQSPADELAYSRGRLERANIALAALVNLYQNDETRRPYENSEYEDLYRKYEESFRKMLLTIKSLDLLDRAIKAETETNNSYHRELMENIDIFGKPLDFNLSYLSPEDRKLWGINDLIVLKDGKLAFSYGNNFRLEGIDEQKASDLTGFFNTANTVSGELHEMTEYELSLRNLSARLESYKMNSEKYRQFGLARDFLLSQLQNANSDIAALKGLYHQADALKTGNLANMPIRASLWGIMRDIPIRDYASVFNGSLLSMQLNAWNKLSAAERADLEFYIILTLTGGGGSGVEGFSRVSEREEYSNVYAQVKRSYDFWADKASIPIIGLAFRGEKAKMKASKNSVESPYNELKNKVSRGLTGLTGGIKNIKNSLSKYKKSSEHLITLRGESDGLSEITWDAILSALTTAGGLSDDELELMESHWNEMTADTGSEFADNTDALRKLAQWARCERDDVKRDLENRYSANEQQRKVEERKYSQVFELFVNGRAARDELDEAISKTYGDEAAAWKNHIENLGRVIITDLGGIMENGTGFTAEFITLTEEYASLATRLYALRCNAEFAAREAEFEQQRRDIGEKYKIWQETTALILNQGRTSWKEGAEKFNLGYNNWVKKYQDEYILTSDAWTAAYLAGLEDKEEWTARAGDAADQASQGALLALVGLNAETMARAMDTRDPLGMMVSSGYDDAESLLTDLLKSTGMENMETAFQSLAGSAGTISTQVRRGLSGLGILNAGAIQMEASKLARETNAELADREAKRMAINTQMLMDETIQNLSQSVDKANEGLRENIDETFIMDGQWRRSGRKYVKEVVVHSTLFDPVITDTASVEGYENYLMGNINLNIKLDEYQFNNLNSMAIQILINDMHEEIKKITEEIFGSNEDEQDKGKFGLHIGQAPVLKSDAKPGESKRKIFQDKGTGELGRLIGEYYYWMLQESGGIGAMSAAPWDKPLWDSRDSFFQAPTIRSVADIGTQIVVGALSPVTGGLSLIVGAALNLTDDFLFGTMDAAGGYKTWDEAGFEFGKKTVMSAVSTSLGAVFNGVEGAAGNTFFGDGGIMGIAAKNSSGSALVLNKTILSGVQATTTAAVNSIIGAVNYNSHDGWSFSNDAFNKSFGQGMIGAAGTTTATFTGGLLGLSNEGFTNEPGKNLYANGSVLANLTGGLAGQALTYALGGDASVNLLNTSFFTQGDIKSGLLEMHLNRDGVGMNLGTGGLNASPDTLMSAYKGLETWKVNLDILLAENANSRTYASQMRTLYARGGKDREQYESIRNGKTIIKEVRAYAGTESILDETTGIKTIYLGSDALEDGSKYGLNVVFSHEAYRDGKDSGSRQQIELNEAFVGHTATAGALMNTYGLGSISREMAVEAGLFAAATKNGDDDLVAALLNRYDNSGDFWLLKKDGTLEDDGSADLHWEAVRKGGTDDDPVYKTLVTAAAGASKEESLVQLLGGADKAKAFMKQNGINFTDEDSDNTLGAALINKFMAPDKKTLNIGYENFVLEKNWKLIYDTYTKNAAFFKAHSQIEARGNPALLKAANQGYDVTAGNDLEYYAILYPYLVKELGLTGPNADPLSHLADNMMEYTYPGWEGKVWINKNMEAGLNAAFKETLDMGGTLPRTDGGFLIRFQDGLYKGDFALSEHSLGTAIDFAAKTNGMYILSDYALKDPGFNKYIFEKMGKNQSELKSYDDNLNFARFNDTYKQYLETKIGPSWYSGDSKPTEIKQYSDALTYLRQNPKSLPALTFTLEKVFVDNMMKYFEWGGEWKSSKDYMHFQLKRK
ncbi:hypothetical protein AGMMS49928_11770 [Spirochaetia bacterium]|nr:hypothetical protein AGMMS49928_11770 [Spirochaetia bacterium]